MQYVVFPHDFQTFSHNFLKIGEKHLNSKSYPDIPIYLIYMTSFALDRNFHWFSFDMSDSKFLWGSNL